MTELEGRGIPFRLIFTGQHHETMAELLVEFNVKTAVEHVYQEAEITGLFQTFRWFGSCLWRFWRERSTLLVSQAEEDDIVLVHGDTLSTLLGTLAAKLAGAKVGHVEAGLRSFRVFQPFPEELTRILVGKLADIAFCPGEWACGNLKGVKILKINTGNNTLRDVLRYVLRESTESSEDGLSNPYVVCSIHRFENIFNRSVLLQIIGIIERVAETYMIAFVLHPTTRKKLDVFGLYQRLSDNLHVRLYPRMGYRRFINLSRQAAFVITDGGSNQEELSYLGIPTLIMRRATERNEGIGSTAVICDLRLDVVLEFMSNLERYRRRLDSDGASPSGLIADAVASFSRV